MNELCNRLYKAMKTPAVVHWRPSTSLHPSAASIQIDDAVFGKRVIGSCLREQYYRITGEPEQGEQNLDYSLRALAGKHYENMVEELFNEHGFQMGIQILAREHPIYQELYNLSGRTDMLAWDYQNSRLIGMEIKSVGEWKAGQVILEPSEEHVMQAMLYLDHYQRDIPEGQAKPEEWYIIYAARVESYQTKNKKHGSPFQDLWDFKITLNDQGQAVVHSSATSKLWPDFSIKNISERYETLQKHLKKKTVPPRDCSLQYTEEQLAGLYKLDRIEYKKDKEPIERWLKQGAPTGKLELKMGDHQCRFCAYATKCWDLDDSITQNDSLRYNLPNLKPETCTESPEQVML